MVQHEDMDIISSISKQNESKCSKYRFTQSGFRRTRPEQNIDKWQAVKKLKEDEKGIRKKKKKRY